jgi:hypothetical protein
MDSLQQLEQDLRYVRAAVERSEADPTPRRICYLWAAIGLIGFALVDLRHEWVSRYWAVAGPAGFVVSAGMGWRHARRMGQVASRLDARHLLHWGSLLAALFLVSLMPLRGVLPPAGVGPTILLLVALAYFQAGVHFDPAFRWIGGVLAAGYIFVLFVDTYAWLTLGVLLAVALVIAGMHSPSEGHGTTI